MSTLARALDIAQEAHAEQLDHAGRPYIDHILRVVASVEGEETKIVAALHDTIEDHPNRFSVGRFLAEGFAEDLVRDVFILTKPKRSSYSAYIASVASQGSPRAKAVKRADLLDNSDPSRLALLSEADRLRLSRKYADALAQIGTP